MDSVRDFIKNPIIQKEVILFKKYIQDYNSYIKNHIEINNNIAFIDNREFEHNVTHSYFVSVMYPVVDIVIAIKNDRENPNRINLAFYRNNFKQKPSEYNLLSVAKIINPTRSGGHSFACGATIPDGMSLEEAKRIILATIRGE